MDTIVFTPPTLQTPGYARRQKRLMELAKLRTMADSSPDEMVKIWEQVVEFMADYIQADTRAAAVALAWDASEEQFNEMFAAMGTASPKATTDLPPNSENLEKV